MIKELLILTSGARSLLLPKNGKKSTTIFLERFIGSLFFFLVCLSVELLIRARPRIMRTNRQRLIFKVFTGWRFERISLNSKNPRERGSNEPTWILNSAAHLSSSSFYAAEYEIGDDDTGRDYYGKNETSGEKKKRGEKKLRIDWERRAELNLRR